MNKLPVILPCSPCPHNSQCCNWGTELTDKDRLLAVALKTIPHDPELENNNAWIEGVTAWIWLIEKLQAKFSEEEVNIIKQEYIYKSRRIGTYSSILACVNAFENNKIAVVLGNVIIGT